MPGWFKLLSEETRMGAFSVGTVAVVEQEGFWVGGVADSFDLETCAREGGPKWWKQDASWGAGAASIEQSGERCSEQGGLIWTMYTHSHGGVSR